MKRSLRTTDSDRSRAGEHRWTRMGKPRPQIHGRDAFHRVPIFSRAVL